MTLIKSNFPWTNISDFFEDDWFRNRKAGSEWMPAVNVLETKESYEIELAAPGIKKEDFSVSMEKGVLTISGKSEEEKEETKKNYTRQEFSSRSFSRSFTLPEDVNEEDVIARHENGILRLTLKKTEKKKPNKKEISIG